VSLNPAGEVDMDALSLGELGVVLGCFHSSLRKKDDQTDRYVAALRNPAIQILGHPRGRIYNFRLGLSADWARVFAVAAELDKAVEIDSYPDRQDMSIDLIGLARKSGCRISIGTDSHGPSQLEFIEFAVAAALKAKIDPNRILNFIGREEVVDGREACPIAIVPSEHRSGAVGFGADCAAPCENERDAGTAIAATLTGCI
jgi:histidinol phosphatase-like PHP family hydrolase